MKMDMDALKALELKMAEYSRENGAIAEHESENKNLCETCMSTCTGQCQYSCSGSCEHSCSGSKR